MRGNIDMTALNRHGYSALCLCIALMTLLGSVLSPSSAISPESDDVSGGRAANYILSIVPANTTQTVDPGTANKSATFGFQVINNGDTSLPGLDLELSPWASFSGNWSYNFIPATPFEVNPGDTKTVLLTIYPAAGAEARRYTFQVKGKTGVASNSISINLDIVQKAGVRVIAPAPRACDPGDTIEFTFEIRNTGTGKDRFFAEPVMVAVPEIVPYLKDGNNWTTDIAAGSSAFKVVVVPVPFDWKTTEGTGGLQLSMGVTSNFNSSVSSVNWTVIDVNHIFDISLDVYYIRASILPGEQAEFNITVYNLRNGQDTISLSLDYSFNQTGWTVNLGQAGFNLSPDRSAITKLKVTPPLDALSGNYTIGITARSSSPSGNPVEMRETVKITILPVRKIQVPTPDISAPPLAPGEAERINISFTNTGNSNDTVNITILEAPVNWTATLDISQQITVVAGQARTSELTVRSSSDPADSQAKSYVIRLRLSNSDRSSVWNITVTVPVKPVYNWSFVVQEPSAVNLNLFLSTRHTFILNFLNFGNTPDELALMLSGKSSWGALDYSIFPLPMGENRTARLEVTVPANTPNGTYTMTVTATSRIIPGIMLDRSVTLNIITEDPASKIPRLALTLSKLEYSAGAGESLEIPVNVNCTGSNVSHVNVWVTQSDGKMNVPYEVSALPNFGNMVAGTNGIAVIKVRVPGTLSSQVKYTLTVRLVGDGVSSEATNITLVLRPARGPTYSVGSLGIALGIFLALGGLALGWNEAVLLALITLFLPLYSKIRKDEVLDRYLRGKIHGYIIANPGEHYSSIKAQLKLKNGTLAYHLRVLEREGYIKSARDGVFKRFYPMDAAIPRKKKEFSSIQEIVLENIRGAPGITQNALARKMGVSTQVVNYHVRQLAAAGILHLERVGRETRCYVPGSDENN
jgi:uncharacterized membrane protein/predicted transcriptional regulator